MKSLLRAIIPDHLAWRRARGTTTITDIVESYCAGNGLEIGAGKTPYGPNDRTTFLDKNIDNKDATVGADIIADAWAIPTVDQCFDFVLSSHVLEHMPNTILALREWVRVLKPAGDLVLILPHAERTLDRFREITTLEHHIEDYQNGVDETDRSHFAEITEGWSKLPNWEEMAAQYRAQWGADRWDWDFRIKHGIIHYHVWTQNEAVRLLQHLRLNIRFVLEQIPERPDSFLVVASNQAAGK